MISKSEARKIAKENNKKIGREALSVLDRKITEEIKSIIKSASRKADFSGRIIINKEDMRLLMLERMEK
ncbi:MAG: histone-like protein [Nanoarchaeota archaeon]